MSSSQFEVCLRGGAPWGFRLTGGKEFRTSLRISKVEAKGKADAAGLAVHDEIIEINGRNVENVYHTEALALVKKAGKELFLALNRTVSSGPGRDQTEQKKDSMIEVTAYGPSSTVPLKPISATSVALNSTTYTDNPQYPTHGYQRKSYQHTQDEAFSEWSPDIISNVTKIPDPIKLQTNTDIGQGQHDGMIENEEDIEERRKRIPQAPTSPQGFEKVKPRGRGARRLTSSSSSSIDIYDVSMENKTADYSKEEPSEFGYHPSNNALRHLQHNKAQTGDGYNKRTASLPRSLGKRKDKWGDMQRSATLPRKQPEDKSKQAGTPGWYKEMYREINKSMEGQSNLSRLLTADAKKGAFRRYDGATSPNSLSPREVRRQRPKSIHVDRFNYDDIMSQERVSKDDIDQRNEGLGVKERREKRHSVHSAWYREFQKGGQIPATGLAADSSQDTRQPTHFRSRSSDDILSTPYQGLPYQTPDQRSPNDRLTNPSMFEYNNPPDLLELRKKAEAEGALREDRERELRMLQEERRKWLQEEEDIQAKKEAARREASRREEEKRRADELKQNQLLEAKRFENRRIEEQKESERQRAMELQKLKETQGNGFRTIESLATTKTEAKALYSFNAQSPVEISFKKGQSVSIIRQVDENWYEGEVNGSIGILPVNYVEICDTDDAIGDQEEDIPVRIEIEEGLAKAKYSFTAENEKELSFKKHEKIIVLRQLDENWYEGEIADRIGIMPKSYLEILKEPRVISNEEQRFNQSKNGIKQQPEEKQTPGKLLGEAPSVIKSKISHPKANNVEAPAEQKPQSLSTPKGERYKSLFSYRPMNEDELELLENDTIYVLEKCDDGWFVGVCERTGKFGTFPGNYVVPS